MRNLSIFKKMYEATAETFLYFAYGSNLLKKRIRINNASAEFLGIGRLEGHQLDFLTYSEHWRGTSATIVPTDGAHVWGAIWRLHVYDMPALDKRLFSTSLNYIMMKAEIDKPNTFLYFSYGENMLTFMIHMNNPSAEYISNGRLDNYRLDFIKYSSFWGGPTATVVPTANGHVWGVLWRLHKDELEKLDGQLGVPINKYYVKNLRILSQHMGFFTARVYIQKVNPLPRGDKDPIPIEYWPSWTYKEIMVMGASEHNFPEYYIKQLKKLQDNGEEGALRTVCLLIRYAKNEPCECRVPGRIPRKPLKLDLNQIKIGRELLTQIQGKGSATKLKKPETEETFLYYAYGSNLLKKRIRINNASAQFTGMGRLDGHQLDFFTYSEKWRGAVATIVPADGAHVWGAIWQLHVRDIPALDNQEGVDTNRYFAKTVVVSTPDGHKVQCRVYQLAQSPPPREPSAALPADQRPSLTYRDCIVNGAKECELPSYYILDLMKIPHNGQTASPKMMEMLNS